MMSIELKRNFPLSSLNTFGIEASASHYIEFNSVEMLKNILLDDRYKAIPDKLVLGSGSNILFTRDYPGLILKNQIKGIEIAGEQGNDVFIKAGAGEIWHDVVLFCVSRNFGGIENLSLIPGTVGASPIQNIGAYGVEIKDVFESLEALSISSSKSRIFSNQECFFGYRDSIFKRELKNKYVITSVTYKLSLKPVPNLSYGAIKSTLEASGVTDNITIKDVSEAVCKIRNSKLPDPRVIGNAGSFFKNPEVTTEQFNDLKEKYPDLPGYPTEPGKIKIPAGWLNEQCGWKGRKIGRAGVHKDQALVLVNLGGAHGNEIKDLSAEIQNSVFLKFGIPLETEVNII
jgi:UDP-N-acetylmuramate dehydrogenase